MEISGGIQASLSGRYALALFELARDERQLDQVSQSLTALKQAIAENADFRALTTSPLVKREAAGRAVAALAPVMGLDRLSANFLGVLAKNGRLFQLAAVIRAFEMLLAQHKGETRAEVTSAHPLDNDQVTQLRDKLRARFGREVAVDLRVDPAILGGLVVRSGSTRIDGSIRTKLNTLAQAMRG